jgi:indole-3-glycerol phosphate synthase
VTTDVLEDILTDRRRRVTEAKERVPLAEMERRARAMPRPHSFLDAVARPGAISLIAEMKKKSPSGGLLREHYDPGTLAAAYERGGAAALSVLTEPARFGGELVDISRAKTMSALPVLRKDFIFDPYQIPESRAIGADAVLLIADMVPAAELKALAALAFEYGLEPLVEIFTPDSLDAALNTGARLIGINTRNLRTLEMRPDNVISLAPRIPGDRFVVAESGIKTPADVEHLRSLPVFAMLVGESLLRDKDPEKAARRLADAGAALEE